MGIDGNNERAVREASTLVGLFAMTGEIKPMKDPRTPKQIAEDNINWNNYKAGLKLWDKVYKLLESKSPAFEIWNQPHQDIKVDPNLFKTFVGLVEKSGSLREEFVNGITHESAKSATQSVIPFILAYQCGMLLLRNPPTAHRPCSCNGRCLFPPA